MYRFRTLLALLFVAAISAACGVRSGAQINYTTSWLGNSGGGSNDQWMQMSTSALYVEPSGVCYVNSAYDETGHEAGIYLEGNVVGEFQGLHGWDRNGGYAIAADSKYVYVGMQQGDNTNRGALAGFPLATTDAAGNAMREFWWGVRRYFKNGLPAPWTQSSRASGDAGSIVGMYDNSMLICTDLTFRASSLPPSDALIRGLAAVNGMLYVSDPHTNQIRIYNISNPSRISAIGSWPVVNPGVLAFDRVSRTLWVAQSGNGSFAPRVAHYSLDGDLLPQTIADIGSPRGLAFDAQGDLMVADCGPDQQIKVYDHLDSTPAIVKTFGDKGGIYSGVRGLVGNGKFNGLTGAGMDAAGNIYATTSGATSLTTLGVGATIESYSPTMDKRWSLNGLEFMDCADADPATDGADLYTMQEHFKLDLSQPAAKPEYVGMTVDELRYPDDARLHIRGDGSPSFRRIQGKPFLFVVDSHSAGLQIFRFDPANGGETAIPSGIIAAHTMHQFQDPLWLLSAEPTAGPWIWRDLNGDGGWTAATGIAETNEFNNGLGALDPWNHSHMWGWSVDDNGDVWQACQGVGAAGGVRHFRCLGLDVFGNPIYSFDASTLSPTPLPFDGSKGGLNRIEYIAGTDTMYLSGYTTAFPRQANEGGGLGRIIARYDHWSGPDRTLAYQIPLTYDALSSPPIFPKAMSVSGGKIFVGYQCGVTAAYGWNGGQIVVYDSLTGAYLSGMTPGPEVGGASGWIDLAHGMRAITRGSGEQLLFVEEDAMAKVLMYRVPVDGSPAASAPVASTGAGSGLTGRYYGPGPGYAPFGKLTLTRIDPTVNFQWLTDSPIKAADATYFSACWSGKIEPRFSDTYAFFVNSDDGIRVWIDGKMIIDCWAPHAVRKDFGSAQLIAGHRHDIRVEYYQTRGQGIATLSWSSASQSREIVPATQLYADLSL